MSKERELILPKFIRTKHLPLEPNAARDDLVATAAEYQSVLDHDNVFIEEKIDGANCGITIVDGYPIIRNRNHILSKSFSGKTPAKMQFSSIWNWFYSHADSLNKLKEILKFNPCIYGEWMYARHSVDYDQLPDYFIAFDIYDLEEKRFININDYREVLEEMGISVVPLLHQGSVDEKTLLSLRDGDATFSSTEKREGIYIRIVNKKGFVSKRYKMVRDGFIQGEHWNKKKLVRNRIMKGE